MPAAKTTTTTEQLIEKAADRTTEIVSKALSELKEAATSDDTRDKFFPAGIHEIQFKLEVGDPGVSIDLRITGATGKLTRELELTPLDEPDDDELLDEEDAQLLEPDEPLLDS